MLLENKQAFLSLVRQGVGHSANPLPECYNWEAIKVIADEQGLTAIVLDGIDKLPAEKRPSQSQSIDLVEILIYGNLGNKRQQMLL